MIAAFVAAAFVAAAFAAAAAAAAFAAAVFVAAVFVAAAFAAAVFVAAVFVAAVFVAAAAFAAAAFAAAVASVAAAFAAAVAAAGTIALEATPLLPVIGCIEGLAVVAGADAPLIVGNRALAFLASSGSEGWMPALPGASTLQPAVPCSLPRHLSFVPAPAPTPVSQPVHLLAVYFAARLVLFEQS